MTRICVLTSVHRPVDQRIFFKECRSMAQAGYDVTLVVPADFDEQMRDGVQLLGVPRPPSRWRRPMTWWRLLRRARSLQPDLIHFHDPELLLMAPLLQIVFGRRVPIVYDVHEYLVDSIAHKVWIPSYLRGAVAWLTQRIERLFGRAVDGLVFVIEEQAALYDGWRAAKAVIHNYPDHRAFANPTPLPEFPADRFRLIYIGSLYARRGIMTMLEALGTIVACAPETLLILGGAFESKSFQRQVETFIAEHGLGQNVILLDWIDAAELKNYLSSADVAWLPGLPVRQYQRPTISTKLLECMLVGLPIVSSDLPFYRPVIAQADCGLLVTADDPSAHAKAILWLYDHPDERQRMGECGRDLVLERYVWEIEASTLQSLYEELLEQKVD